MSGTTPVFGKEPIDVGDGQVIGKHHEGESLIESTDHTRHHLPWRDRTYDVISPRAMPIHARIDLLITSADGKNTILTKAWTDGKYVGVRNTTFHEHVDIPAATPAGDYKLTFTVTDKAGQSSVFTSDLKIEVPVEGSPVINITEAGENNSKTAVVGGEMHLEAEISAPKKIDNIEVELHNTEAKYEKVFTFKEKYLGQAEAHFHEHLQIPADAPAGEYHIHFTVTDAEGNSTTEEVEGVQITEK